MLDRQDGDQWWVEMPLLDALQKVDKDLGGTADYVRYRPSDKTLRVMDFKYGSGTFVDVDDNEQLKLYALGTMLEVNQPIEEVEISVVQPRFEGAKPVRSWIFPAVEILDFIVDVQEAIAKTREEGAPRAAGDWCKFCPAARPSKEHPDGCPELMKKQHALISQDFAVDLGGAAGARRCRLGRRALHQGTDQGARGVRLQRGTEGHRVPRLQAGRQGAAPAVEGRGGSARSGAR
jgi:hypothetical protein